MSLLFLLLGCSEPDCGTYIVDPSTTPYRDEDGMVQYLDEPCLVVNGDMLDGNACCWEGDHAIYESEQSVVCTCNDDKPEF